MKHTLETVMKTLDGCNVLTCENYDKVKLELVLLKEELREMKTKHSPKLEVRLHTLLDDILGVES